jgi:hypothetical protein
MYFKSKVVYTSYEKHLNLSHHGLIFFKLITPHIAAGKVTEIFCENMKVLLFEDEQYKEPIF